MTQPTYLRTEELALRYGTSASFWNKLRVSGRGPAYSLLGRRVVYDLAEVETWFQANKRQCTGDRGVS